MPKCVNHYSSDSGRRSYIDSFRRMISALELFYDRVVSSLAFLAGILVIFLMLVIFVDVTLRYVTGYSISWAFEASEYTLLYVTFLGTAWLLKRDAHVKLDILLNWLEPRPKAYLNLIASIMLIIVCILLLWFGADSTIDNFQRHVTSVKYYAPPKWVFLVIIPVGSFLLTIEAVKKTCSCIRQVMKSESSIPK